MGVGPVRETTLESDGIAAHVVGLVATVGFRTVVVEGDAGIGKSTTLAGGYSTPTLSASRSQRGSVYAVTHTMELSD